MSVLTDGEIRHLVHTVGLITDFDDASLEGASYDLRLGAQYVERGQIRTLTDQSPSHVLEPGEFVILTSYERLNMPLDLVGHNGIMSPWAKRGLVSLFSPQIEPGFRGFLTVPVFNAGDASVTLVLRERMFTVEFVVTSAPASWGWSDRHGDQTIVRITATPSATRPNLADVKGVIDLTASLGQRLVDIDSRLVIMENRVTDVVTGRGLRIGARGVVVAVVALIVAVLALPWVAAGIKEWWEAAGVSGGSSVTTVTMPRSTTITTAPPTTTTTP